MNILAFLFMELDKVMEDFKKSSGAKVSYQGLILMIFKRIAMQMGVFDSLKWPTMDVGKEEGVMAHNTGEGQDRKQHAKVEDEDCKLVHVERKSPQTYGEKVGLVYIEASNFEGAMEIQEMMDKIMKLLNLAKGS